MTVELALRGLPELLLPFHRDMGFWESLDDEKAHYDYLRSLPRADLPTIEQEPHGAAPGENESYLIR